jgi:general secretion pathway protein F/type IV pilus assembly protein PilC
MALFRYRAFSQEGAKIKGVVDAESLELAKERLLKQRLLITDLFILDQKKQEVVLTPSLLLSFTRELGQLLRAGLPLYESLLTIEEKYRQTKEESLFLDLCDHLKRGYSFSYALQRHPKSFDTIYLSMVQAAEESGSLPLVFDQLSQLIARQQKLRKKIISALTYPCILGAFCVVVVFALLVFVVPSMQALFEGRPLHPLTALVLMASQWVCAYGNLLVCFAVGLGVTLFFCSKKPSYGAFLQRALLKFPFFKTVIIQAALIRFCRSMAVLLNGGVPMLSALSLSCKVMKNLLLEKVVQEATQKIAEGGKLSQQFKKSSLIPTLLVRMLAIAEETGKMAPMLQNVAEIYDEELEKNLEQMTTLLQPLLLLTLGLIVGGIVLSIMLPLTDVSSFLSY